MGCVSVPGDGTDECQDDKQCTALLNCCECGLTGCFSGFKMTQKECNESCGWFKGSGNIMEGHVCKDNSSCVPSN